MSTWYLAGPMTGKLNFNYDEFHGWAALMRKAFAKDTIINPAENFAGDQSLSFPTYLKEALSQVARADKIVMLPGWRESKLGAHIELVVAQALGKKIYELHKTQDTLGWSCVETPMRITIHHSPLASDPMYSYQVHVGQPEPSPETTSAEEFGHANKQYLQQPPYTRCCGHDECRVLAYGHCADCLEEPVLGDHDRIVDEAWDLVMGDREAAYGHPASDFEAMGRISGAILNRWLQSQGLSIVDGDQKAVPFPDIAPHIVALLMTAVKLSRESAVHKHDNLVDLIGYTVCADRIQEGY